MAEHDIPVSRLSDQINKSTRLLHSRLNRLIIDRLPLALPPYQDSDLYLSGLLHIALLYITFEDSWQSMLKQDSVAKPVSQDPGFTSQIQPARNSRICSIIGQIRIPGLPRGQRLRSDLALLLGGKDDVESLLHRCNTGKLAQITDHIKLLIAHKPHIIMAYAWVFYMALFAGGRHLRRMIADAEPPWASSRMTRGELPSKEYWRGSPEQPEHGGFERRVESMIPPPETGSPNEYEEAPQALNFFGFDGVYDGEDMKSEFKKQFSQAEIRLTAIEKDDIILEAQEIFKFMINVVDILDALCN